MAEPPRNFDFIGCRALAGAFGVIGLVLAAWVLIPFVRYSKGPKTAEIRARAVQISAALKQYSVEYGAFPTGDHARIIAALRGNNQKQFTFFESSDHSFNGQGELIDPWGTPFRFDLSDPQNPRVWSCGKDRRDDGGAKGSDDIPSWR